MNRAEALNTVDQAFAEAARPTLFIRGTCACEECLEHNETMGRFLPKELPLEPFNNPGWDPVCFASDAAYCYLLPGLARLVLYHTDAYLQQFLFHVTQPDRLLCLTRDQAKALVTILDLLVLEESTVNSNCAVEDLFSARAALEAVASGGPSNT